MLALSTLYLFIYSLIHLFIYLFIYLFIILSFRNNYIYNITIPWQEFISYSSSEFKLSPGPDLLHCHQTYHGPTMDFLNELLICLTFVVEVALGHHANKIKS